MSPRIRCPSACLIRADLSLGKLRSSSRSKMTLFNTLDLKNMDMIPENQESFINAGNGFGKFCPHVSKALDSKPKSKYLTSEELSASRIPESDWELVPVLKNYKPGIPSNKLYLKNLAKATTEADLKYIFGGFLKEDKESSLQIRIMKEGRMKGQAFLTFLSTEEASEALRQTNGYIFKDKPIVICFGRSKTNN